MSILPQYESLCNKKYTEQIKKINILKQILLFSSNLQLLYRITFDFSFNENYKIYNFKFRPKKGVPIGRNYSNKFIMSSFESLLINVWFVESMLSIKVSFLFCSSYIFSSIEFFVINLYTCTFLFCPIR